MENLTSLQNAKAWCGATSDTDDQVVAMLINAASRAILSYLERETFFYSQNTEVRDGDGYGCQSITLNNYPVLSVSSLTIGSQIISILSAGDTSKCGAVLDPASGRPPGSPQMLNLRGYSYSAGLGNVKIQYTSGYVVQNEPATVPSTADYIYTVNAPYGNWGADVGVSYANGNPLTLATGTPTAGQYTVTQGKYTFASADSGAAVLVSYSYIPADIEQVCLEWVGERYKVRNRIGMITTTINGQQTASYSQKGLSEFAKILLNPYQNIIL